MLNKIVFIKKVVRFFYKNINNFDDHRSGWGPPLKVLCNKSPSPYFKFINPI